MKDKGIIYQKAYRRLAVLFVFFISLSAGKLFELFYWNSSIVRVECVAQISKAENSSYNYLDLNKQFWVEKAKNDAIAFQDFSNESECLGQRIHHYINILQNQYISYKPELLQRFILRVVYSDIDLA